MSANTQSEIKVAVDFICRARGITEQKETSASRRKHMTVEGDRRRADIEMKRLLADL